jgi:hypothetical protein
MKYRKKPVVIEAIRYLGPESHNLVRLFVGNDFPLHQIGDDRLGIPTFEGWISVCPGDWIIKDIKGELYSCKDDIFRVTYELVEQKTPSKLSKWLGSFTVHEVTKGWP